MMTALMAFECCLCFVFLRLFVKHLPPPVLAFHDVTFGYPKCEPLYTNVNLGVDLDSRAALVGPNGAGANGQRGDGTDAERRGCVDDVAS